jgi:uncharacterized protein
MSTTSANTSRIIAIDTLRGFALLGILLMNIVSFAMPEIAYLNPNAFGGDEWYNRLTHAVVYIIADQKFMALFSLLFGASIMLLLTKLREQGRKTARFHYIRNFWLLVFGIIHGIFWFGDILFVYAICGFILFFLRNLTPRWQFTLGIVLFLSPALLYIAGNNAIEVLPPEDQAILADFWMPSDEVINAEIERYRAGYPEQVGPQGNLTTTSSTALETYLSILLYNFLIRALGMMLIGMAFYSWGIVTAKRSNTFYWRMTSIGFGVGVPLIIFGLWLHDRANWESSYSPMIGQIPNLLATPFVACAYVALIMLWSRSNLWQAFQQHLAAVGKMALTNYIMQTIIATTLFYGHGLGWFGTIDRFGLLLVILGIWSIQLLLSPLWIARFRYGPLEWLWRSLSYGAIQPIRKENLRPHNPKS